MQRVYALVSTEVSLRVIAAAVAGGQHIFYCSADHNKCIASFLYQHNWKLFHGKWKQFKVY